MITSLGTATLDIILKSKDKIFTGSKINIDEVFFFLGGGALNAAKTFKNLNLPYKAFFRLGNDLIGKIILEKVKKERFNSKIFFHQGNSQFSFVFLHPNSERTIFVYRGISDHFNLKELYQIPFSDYYYLTTANTNPIIFKKFLERIKPKAKIIFLNPSKKFLENKNSEFVLKLVDILFLNEEEIFAFLKRKDNALNLGKELYHRLRIPILILTLGEKGSLTFYQDKIFKASIFKPKKLVDKTGAGDAFGSAFLGSLVLNKEINEENIKKAIIWGSANASANLEKLGAQIGLLKKKDYQKYKNLKIEMIKNG